MLNVANGVLLTGDAARMVVDRSPDGEYVLVLEPEGRRPVRCRVPREQLRYALDALDTHATEAAGQ